MDTQKTEWIRDTRCRADDALRALHASKKQHVGEHDERMRKLKALAEFLFIKQADGQGELFDPKTVLSPDIEELLSAPLHGLD
jgi:hypothetical protein